nr:unnamed protein product [Digitaria exilis]
MEKAEELTLPLHLLPDDVLAGVLARLSPRGLAASRCVCKAWRAVVDARRLLRKELLPFSVGGIFLVPCAIGFPPLFTPPSPTMRHADEDDLGYLEGARDLPYVAELEPYLDELNPRTEEPYYEVLSAPEQSDLDKLDPAIEKLEWPPSPCAMRVFSSRTGHWDERLFIREGPTLGTVAGMRYIPYNFGYHSSVYWQGALYVQCHRNNFVMRINTSTGRYQLIAPPASRICGCDGFHLGKSEKGVYYAKITYQCELLVWFLDDSDGQAQWVLRCDRIVCPMEARRNHAEINGPWFLQFYGNKDDYPEELLTITGDDDVYDNSYLVDEYMAGLDEVALEGETRPFYMPYSGTLTFLGFHPYKEIVFLNFMDTRGVAYHLSTSKMQDLGSLELKRRVNYSKEMSIVYTPCWM